MLFQQLKIIKYAKQLPEPNVLYTITKSRRAAAVHIFEINNSLNGIGGHGQAHFWISFLLTKNSILIARGVKRSRVTHWKTDYLCYLKNVDMTAVRHGGLYFAIQIQLLATTIMYLLVLCVPVFCWPKQIRRVRHK